MSSLPTPPKGENYFRTLFEACGESFIVTNAQGQAIDCNDAALELLSCQRSDILGTTPLDWSPKLQPDGKRSDERAAEIFSRAAAGETVCFEWENYRRDRKPVFVNVTVRRAVIDAQVCYLVVSRNASDHKQAEDALREERLLRDTIQDAIPGVAYALDANGIFRFWSHSFESVTGRNAEELKRINATDLFEGNDRIYISERIKTVFAQGASDAEAELVAKDGHHTPFYFTGRRIELNGEPILVGAGMDITARVQAERALRESEARFRTLFEQAAVGVAEIDTLSGRFLAINRKYCEIVGYCEAELLRLDFPSITHPDDLANDLAHMEKLKTGQIRDFNIEKRYFHKDGHLVWVDLTVSPMWAPENPPDKHIAIVQDITLRKEVECQLERLARTDDLTGLVNRRHFLAQAELELSRSIRYGRQMSILMVDADLFKSINDQHGHAAGDSALKQLADIFRGTLRSADLAGRFGGEEFAILLPETDHAMAIESAERLRRVVAESKVPLKTGLQLQFTVSIGVSSLISRDDNLDMLISLADKGLYMAKNTGRNKVCSSLTLPPVMT